MNNSYIKVVVTVGLEPLDVLPAIDQLRDYADENHLHWNVARAAPSKLRIDTQIFARDLDVGAIQAISMTVQEVELSLASSSIPVAVLPAQVTTSWHGLDETIEDEY